MCRALDEDHWLGPAARSACAPAAPGWSARHGSSPPRDPPPGPAQPIAAVGGWLFAGRKPSGLTRQPLEW